MRVCLLQFASQGNLTLTLNHLEELVSKAVAQHQPHVITLPECFNFEYCTEPSILKSMAESLSDGVTCRQLSMLSKKFGIFIVGGSIVESDGSNLYNTTTVWNPSGYLIAKYRKVGHFKTQFFSYIELQFKCEFCILRLICVTFISIMGTKLSRLEH